MKRFIFCKLLKWHKYVSTSYNIWKATGWNFRCELCGKGKKNIWESIFEYFGV